MGSKKCFTCKTIIDSSLPIIAIVIVKRISHAKNASASTCKMLGSKLPIVRSRGIIHHASKTNGMPAITDKGMARLCFLKFNEFMIFLF